MFKKENTPQIETERLILRKFADADCDDMFLIYSDKEVNEFLPWFSFATIEETRNYLHGNIFTEYKKAVAYRYAVVYKPTNQVVGYVSLCGIDESKACGDLGYGLRKDFWGQGIISEACKAVLAKLRENGFQTITATHDVNNSKSGRVMQKLGMVYSHSYEELWQPKNIKVTFNLYKIDFTR